MASTAGQLAKESVVQWIAGSVVGTAIEYFLPFPTEVTGGNFLKVMLEVGAEVILDGFITYHAFMQLREWGLSELNDPNSKLIFQLAIQASQPNLFSKISNLNTYAKSFLNGVSLTPLTDINSVGKSGNPVNQDMSAQLVTTVSARDYTSPFDRAQDD